MTKTKGNGGQPAAQNVTQNPPQTPVKAVNTKGTPWWNNETRQQDPSSASDPKGEGAKKGKK